MLLELYIYYRLCLVQVGLMDSSAIMLTFARIRPVKLVWSTLLLTLLVSTFDITRLRLPTLLYLFFLIQPGIILQVILFWTRCSMHTVLLPAAKFVYGASLDLDDCSVSPLLLLQELLVNIAYLFFSCMCVHFPIHAPSLQTAVLSVQWAVLKV